jgi:hypothetical protein
MKDLIDCSDVSKSRIIYTMRLDGERVLIVSRIYSEVTALEI